jgi:endonuclease I
MISYSQIPNDYYRNAIGKTGSELKAALHEIIDEHKSYPYSSSEIDTWDILKITDRDPNNTDNVILFYTGRSVNANQEYNEGKGWNREHIWSKSRGQFGNDPGAGTDVHALRPCDIRVNSAKNNRWFAECNTPLFDDPEYKETGPWISHEEWILKPRQEVKGDVARMLFYMAVRYEGESGEPDLELINRIPEDQDSKAAFYAKLSDLIAWHEEDPVNDTERRRNDIIFKFQHNRNPFIDHPEYVRLIWDEDGLIGEAEEETKVSPYELLDQLLEELLKVKRSGIRTGLHVLYKKLNKE